MRTVQIIAHRGYRERYPENSLAGLEAAIAAGADAVELDVQFCRDGTPVVLHDIDLRRLTGQPGQLLELDLEQLRAYSAHEPERFGERFRPTPIATLEQVVERLARHADVTLFVEIKRDSLPMHAIPAGVDRVLKACRPLGDRLVLISFDDGVLQQARSLDDVAVGWVLSDWNETQRERAETVKPDYLFVSDEQLPPAPTKPWPGPWRWAVYEVNEPAAARALIERGFDAVETAAVETLARALKS